MLKQKVSPTFKRDVKRLKKKHADVNLLKDVMLLIIEDSKTSKTELRRKHNMHALKGGWSGNLECHVANTGDWLLIWCVENGYAVFQRTGRHDELFRKGQGSATHN